MRKIVSPLDGIRSPFGRATTGTTPPPPASIDTLLLVNGSDSLLLADGASFLKLASSP